MIPFLLPTLKSFTKQIKGVQGKPISLWRVTDALGIQFVWGIYVEGKPPTARLRVLTVRRRGGSHNRALHSQDSKTAPRHPDTRKSLAPFRPVCVSPSQPPPLTPGSHRRPCRADVQGRRTTGRGTLPSSLGSQGERGTVLRGVCPSSPPPQEVPAGVAKPLAGQEGEGRGPGPGDADRPVPAWRGSPCSWRRPWSL